MQWQRWLPGLAGRHPAIRPTANTELDGLGYDFRVVDTPAELHQLIEARNQASNKARVVAGYCWGWPARTTRKPMTSSSRSPMARPTAANGT